MSGGRGRGSLRFVIDELAAALLDGGDVRDRFEVDPVGVLGEFGLGAGDLRDLAAAVEARTAGVDGPERRVVHGLLYLALHATGQ